MAIDHEDAIKKDAFYDIITRALVWHDKDTFNEQDYSITMWYIAKQKQRRKEEKKKKALLTMT